jgi:DNA-binding SARP family transcriptional activator
MDFGILGPLRVVVGGAVRPVGPRKHRVVLASLLLRPNRPVQIDELVNRLWPTCPPGGARRTVQTYVMRLRQELGSAGYLVRTCAEGYLIQLEPGQLDLERFVRLVEVATNARRAGDPVGARADLGRALAEWRGAPLADVPLDMFLRAEVAHLVELRCQAVEQRIELELELGTAHELVGELRMLIAEHPLRERFWALLMRVLCRTGRCAEALVAYHEVDRLLGEELGVEPGQQLRRLHAELLSGAG